MKLEKKGGLLSITQNPGGEWWVVPVDEIGYLHGDGVSWLDLVTKSNLRLNIFTYDSKRSPKYGEVFDQLYEMLRSEMRANYQEDWIISDDD